MPNMKTIQACAVLCLMLLLCLGHAVARPISEEKACAVATRFYYMKTMGDAIKKVKALKALDLVYSPQHGGEMRYTQPEYFVFAPENGKGFVIVSGEDRAGRLIVGYSTEARISHRLSSSLQGYLNCYAEYIDALRKGKAEPKPQRKAVAVAPLLTTQWGQHAPYNYYCPVLNEEKLITGCVTTAVAQIMKYHAWPQSGHGQCTAEVHNLDTTYTTVILGDVYDWKKMKDSYSHSAKVRTGDVARLMRDVGHAVNMKYSPVLSGTNSAYVLKALTEHFDYSPEMKMVHRWQHTDEQWNRMIADELAAGRPIYYSSRSTKYDGHAFVVCGMDEQGLYYVNWGWGGSCDGYFDFDVVTSADATYNYVQSAIVGICPLR